MNVSDLSLIAVRRWEKDPILFVRESLSAEPWDMQQTILRAIMRPETRRVAVKSCHAAGKTHLAALAVLTWLFTGRQRVVITTAPTWRQVKELLWKEIRVIYNRCRERGCPLGGELPPSAPELRISDDWLAIGFSSDDPINMQGWHSPGGLLVVMDEANGISPPIWEALQGVLTGSKDRLLAIANPTERGGPFYDLWEKDESAIKFTISAYDTPNVKARREIIPGLVTHEWIEDRKARWGESSSIFRSRVLGEFPDADDGLVPLAWIEAANRRWDKLNTTSGWEGHATLGVDVARYGPDSTIGALCYPHGVRELLRFRKADTMETAAWVMSLLRERDDIADVHVDGDGLGAGVVDALRMEHSDRIVEMRGGMSAIASDRFANRRAEWFWTLRERLNPNHQDAIALPPEEKITEQLTMLRHSVDPKGRVVIESKDDLRRRIGQSPDEADSVAYACAVMEKSVSVTLNLSAGYRPNPWSV